MEKSQSVKSGLHMLVVVGLCLAAPSLWAQDPYAGAEAYWRFDEGSGTKTYDSVNGYLIDMFQVNWVPGVMDQCLSFNGSNAYATAWDRELVSTGFTFTAWVKPNNSAAEICVLSKYWTSGNHRSYVWRTAGYDTYLAVSSDGIGVTQRYTTGNRLSTNWNFIAATYDGTTIRLYVNGNTPDAEIAHADGVYTNGEAQIWIGRQSGDYFNGLIDELAIWSYALSDAEIQSVRDAAPVRKPQGAFSGAEAHWELDEHFGLGVYDYVHGWNGEVHNVGANDWVPGVMNQCMSLNGSSAYVDLYDRELVSTAFTFTAWVKPVDPAAYKLVLSKYVTGGDNRSFNWVTSGYDTYLGISSDGTSAAGKLTSLYTTSNKLTADWNFIAATYDGTDIRLYVNSSTPEAVAPHSGGVYTGGTAPIEMGRQASTYFNGLVDEVAIWTYALTDAEIEAVKVSVLDAGTAVVIR